MTIRNQNTIEAMTMTTRTAPKDRALARYRLIALWIPILLAVIVAAVQATVTEDLTARVGTHFELDGTVDGWGPAWTYPVMTVGLGVGMALLMGLLGLMGFKGIGSSGRPARLRTMAGLSIGVSVFLIGTLVGAAIESANGANLIWIMLISVVIGVVVGWLGYRFSFDVEGDGSEPAQPRPLELSVDERAVWTATTSMGKPGWWLHIGAAVVMVACLGLSIWAEVSEDGRLGWVSWLMLVLTVAVVVGMPAFIAAAIRVDATGFTVRSTMGWPKIKIPLDRIDKVEVVDVNPMGEFGGWGWRQGLGSGKGVVLRAGEGLRITRTNGKLLTVTMDDAATAAALLEGLKARV